MGTTYNIKLISPSNELSTIPIKNEIDSLLIILNKQMSTWDDESEISKFNSWESLEPFKVSENFLYVVDNAINISIKTSGVFDITIFDLMALWGFGPRPESGFPIQKDIDRVLDFTGYEKIRLGSSSIIKSNKKTKIDLNAIAKGYGVDIVFNFLKNKGFDNFFVEIGGEVRFAGNNKNNKLWSTGIEDPIKVNEQQNTLCAVLNLTNRAIATSGNYKNFVDNDGVILGHTINPITGYPIKTDVLSVTVLSKQCMIADAWATALMAMDFETGLDIINSDPNLDAVWVVRDNNSSGPYIVKSGNQKLKRVKYPIKAT